LAMVFWMCLRRASASGHSSARLRCSQRGKREDQRLVRAIAQECQYRIPQVGPARHGGCSQQARQRLGETVQIGVAGTDGRVLEPHPYLIADPAPGFGEQFVGDAITGSER
jgi:hypothetical protein